MANSSVNCKGHANVNCSSRYGSYLFHVDSPIARQYTVRCRRDRAKCYMRQKQRKIETEGASVLATFGIEPEVEGARVLETLGVERGELGLFMVISLGFS